MNQEAVTCTQWILWYKWILIYSSFPNRLYEKNSINWLGLFILFLFIDNDDDSAAHEIIIYVNIKLSLQQLV